MAASPWLRRGGWLRQHGAAERLICTACPSQRRCRGAADAAPAPATTRVAAERRGLSAGAGGRAGGGRSAAGGGIWAAAKRTADRLETWMKSQAVAGSRKIFLFNLSQQLERVDEARGLAALYVQRVREACERLEGAAAAHRTDDRSVYHIQTACLVLASFRVLTEQLRMSPCAALECIRQCLGDSDSVGERAVAEAVKLSSRVMVTALRGDESSFLIRTAHNMSALDFGASFDVTHDDSSSRHVAQVNRWSARLARGVPVCVVPCGVCDSRESSKTSNRILQNIKSADC